MHPPIGPPIRRAAAFHTLEKFTMSLRPMLATDTLDVQQFIDQQRFSASQWLVFGVCFLIMVADGFDTAAIGFVLPSLTREWGVAKLALGPVLSASLIGLAIGALAAGPCADRLGRKPVLIAAVLAFGVFSWVCGYAESLNFLATYVRESAHPRHRRLRIIMSSFSADT